ncbi:protein phosphatase 2C domain-containing protein [uncultured Cellulomonas sp.]|uniref:protein phosphatase 2C domain-containing protein n=1 Tax=uncultured Cellulomonas sp. TaxID=189682 RepID=UPI0026338437|nr:protein phosphatase 2C domain-containing protein [uncultured Cellulomonas sp.]
MGTTRAPVARIAAATRQGSGSTNQDRYVVGEHYAAVLDGASSESVTIPGRDGGWYAEALSHRLVKFLDEDAGGTTADVVARAIADVRDAYSLDPESTPTSTVAIARWTDTSIDLFVLGDSTAVALLADGTELLQTDDRLANVARAERDAYLSRLASGAGYDPGHRDLLRRLQAHQRAERNQPGGYWIAGAEPGAAYQAITTRLSRHGAAAIVLATDGAASAVDRYQLLPDWQAFVERLKTLDLAPLLLEIEQHEAFDPNGQHWPRGKRHDDKTAVYVGL